MCLTVLTNDESNREMLAPIAVQSPVLVALIQCSQVTSKRTCGFGIREKIRCSLRFFLAYFCAVLRFSGPPYAPLLSSCKLVDSKNEMALFLTVSP